MELNSNFELFQIFYIVFFGLFILALIFGIPFILYKFAARSYIRKPKKVHIALPFACLLISAAAFIFNMGWFRVILTIFFIAPLMAAFFLYSSLYAADCAVENKTIRIYTIISYITFSLTYMLLPDFGDDAAGYVFFFLIKNDTVTDIAFTLAILCAITNLILNLLQLLKAEKLKKSHKQNLSESI